MVISGDLGSAEHTGIILKWLLSWLPPLKPDEFEWIHFYTRKIVGHFGNYALVYLLWFRAFRSSLDYRPLRACLWSLCLCLVMASVDEGHQAMFASRGSSPKDVILDMSGAMAAALIAWLFRTPLVRRVAQ